MTALTVCAANCAHCRHSSPFQIVLHYAAQVAKTCGQVTASAMGQTLDRHLIDRAGNVALVLLFLLPLFMAIVPWDLFGNTNWRSVIVRTYSLHVTMFHILFIPVGILAGCSVFAEWHRLPYIVRNSLFGLLATSLFTIFAVAPNKSNAIISLLQLVLVFLFFLTFSFIVRGQGKAFVDRLWFSLGAGIIAYLVFWAITLVVRWPPEIEWIMAAVPGMSNVRSIGFFSLVAFCAGISVANSELRYRYIIAAIFIVCGAWGSALWTGSRGPVLAIVLAGLFYILVSPGSKKWNFVLVFGSLIVAVILVYPIPYESDIYGLQSLLLGNQKGDLNSVSSGRVEIWKNLLVKFLDNPIFGIGLDQYYQPGSNLEWSVKQPHNWPIQIIFSTGIFGFTLLLLVLKNTIRIDSDLINFKYNLPFSVFSFGFLIYSLYDGVAYYLYPITIAAIVLSFLRFDRELY